MINLHSLKSQSLKAWIGWLFFLVSWEVVVDYKIILSKAFFASPTQILSEFTRFDFWKVLLIDGANSLSLILVSGFLGYTIASMILLASMYSKTLYKMCLQLDAVWKYVPIPVLIPFGILFFGLGVGSKIFILTFCTLVLYFSHCMKVVEQEESSYKLNQISWKISSLQRFKYFVFPLTNALNYRVWSSLVVWVFGVSIIAEMLLGGTFGLGIRLLQYQQLYQTSRLFAYLVIIIAISFALESILSSFFRRTTPRLLKSISSVLLIVSICSSFIFLAYSNLSLTKERSIITYKAALNLPLMVYAEKYNTLKIKLQFVASGIQVMDTLQASKTDIGGFADMPNVLTGINKNSDLKILNQVAETKDQPTLFMISRKKITIESFTDLASSKIAYFPNNPLIKNGLDFTLFSSGTATSNIEYSSSNDPNSLIQAFNSGKYDSFLGPEPYISNIEKNTDLKRINPKNSLIRGINFSSLPLAALVVNTQQLSETDTQQFRADITKSIDFIRQHSDSDHKATGELKNILSKYEISDQVSLSKYEVGAEIDLENTKNFVRLINLFDSQSNLSEDKVADNYI
jgi:putative hydroxymethylpyrimidine transport system permease protein